MPPITQTPRNQAAEPLATPPPQPVDPMIIKESEANKTLSNQEAKKGLLESAAANMDKQSKQVKRNPGSSGHSVAMAITATVIIVIALSVLAIYAYTKR
jgi:hypothetical protein